MKRTMGNSQSPEKSRKGSAERRKRTLHSAEKNRKTNKFYDDDDDFDIEDSERAYSNKYDNFNFDDEDEDDDDY